MEDDKKILLLIVNIFAISCLAVSTPKIFTVMAPSIAESLAVPVVFFNNFLYRSSLYSLMSRMSFAFIFNTKSFCKVISTQWFYFIGVILHFFAVILCMMPNLQLHVLGRYMQGATAGILMLLIEPLIINLSPSKARGKLLKYKYEIIALIAPITILITGFTDQWKSVITIFSIGAIISSAILVFTCRHENIRIVRENNLFKGFCRSFFIPQVFINSVCTGLILGIFLIGFQYNFIHKFPNFNPILASLIQGLPFTLSFIISKLPGRRLWNLAVSFLILIVSLLRMIVYNTDCTKGPLYFISYPLLTSGYLMGVLVNLLYITYVLSTPDILCKMLEKNNDPNITDKAILTASQVIRTVSTSLITNMLNSWQARGDSYAYYMCVCLLILVSIFLKDKEIIENKPYIAYPTMGFLILVLLLFLYISRRLF